MLIDQSHSYFAATCLFNMLFLVCFLHREIIASLVFLLLLFVTLILWYIKVHAWYVTVTLKTDDQIKAMKQEFDRAHAEEEDELRSEKWDTVEIKLRKKDLKLREKA